MRSWAEHRASVASLGLAVGLALSGGGRVAEARTAAGHPVSTHRVLAGETLYRIARAHQVSVEALLRANGLEDPRQLRAGQVITIPSVQPPAPPPAQPPPPPPPPPPRAKLREERRQEPPTPDWLARSKVHAEPRAESRVTHPSPAPRLRWPLRGTLYGRFSPRGRGQHDGIDLAAPPGTPVVTAAEGRVVYAGPQDGYGLIVLVSHGGGLLTLYAHNRDVRVKTGQRVRRDQVIATVGETGRTSGPHLHFEVRREGQPVDPLEYLGSPESLESPGAARTLDVAR